jgi:hypothetical protein
MKHGILSFLLTLWMAAAGALLFTPSPGAQAAQTYDYSDIDSHALSAPTSAEHSIESLAAYLTEPARNDREKARAIYRWIANNISYDVHSLDRARTAKDRVSSAKDTLETRGGVCAGYSQLFQQLAQAAGLKAVEIEGASKGVGYAVDPKRSDASGHAWNAVSIDGKWRLIDCAWGAGYVNPRGQYVREFDEHFFLTPPEEFIYDHFPTDPRWQCLSRPLSKDEFDDLPCVGPAFFRNSLRIVGQDQATIKADDSVILTLAAPDDVLVMAKLAGDGQGDKPLAIAQREDGQYKIYASLPRIGKYNLQVFVKRADDPGQYSLAASYFVVASKGAGEGTGFPETFATFSERNGRVYLPMSGHLKSGGLYPFRIKAPGAEEVAVINGGEWVHLTKNNDMFEGRVMPGSGKVKVAAKYPGQNNYSVLLEYQADDRGSRLPAGLAVTE